VPSIINNLLFDHERIVKEFNRIENVKDFDLSIQILKNLINYLNIHAKKEDELFSTIVLSNEELKRMDEKVKLMNF